MLLVVGLIMNKRTVSLKNWVDEQKDRNAWLNFRMKIHPIPLNVLLSALYHRGIVAYKSWQNVVHQIYLT